MTRDQALRLVRAAATDGRRVYFTGHAEARMRQRRITRRQVLACLGKGVIREGPGPDIKGNWSLRMERWVAGDKVTVALAIDALGDVIVVTVM